MPFMYEGVDVDKPAAGFSDQPTEAIRANNIIALANKRIKYFTDIAASYNKAYSDFAAFKTAYPDPRAKGYSFATFTRLQLELDKWKDIVIKNGGKLKSAGASGGGIGDAGQTLADFSAKINKYNQDISKYQLVLQKYVPICVWPTADQALNSMSQDAANTNNATVSQASAEAGLQVEYYKRLKELTNPNASKDVVTPGRVESVLNMGIKAGVLVWGVVELGLLASTLRDSRLLSSQILRTTSNSLISKKPIPPLSAVRNILVQAIKSRGGR